MNEEQQLRQKLYNEAVGRGAKDPTTEARQAYAFIMAGTGVRKSKKKNQEPPTIEMFKDEEISPVPATTPPAAGPSPYGTSPAAAILDPLQAVNAAVGEFIAPPILETGRTEVQLVPVATPEPVKTMTDEELRAAALARAKEFPGVGPGGIMGVEV